MWKVFALTLFGMALFSQLLSAQVMYTITDLGTLGGASSSATALFRKTGSAPDPLNNAFYTNGNSLNDSGHVVGDSLNSSGLSRPFSYGNSVMSQLAFSEVEALNNSEQFAGFTNVTGGNRAIVSDGQNTTTFGTFGGSFSSAWNINNNGTVVGYSYLAGNSRYHAFESSGSAITDLGVLGTGIDSRATAINDNGYVVGYSDTSTDTSQRHAFLYDGTSITDLGTLGGSASYASAINNSRTIVGLSQISGNGALHAFVDNGGSMRDLNTLGGTNSVANGINNAGEVVGYSDTSSGSEHAFASTNGSTITDLNTLISPSSGWTLNYAGSVNSKGQIAGSGTNASGQTHAFLLTPLPVLKTPTVQTPTQPIVVTPSLQAKTGSFDNLILVTHGLWDSGSDPWVQTMALSIANKIGSSTAQSIVSHSGYYTVGNTIVTAFDWGSVANALGQQPVTINFAGKNVGRELGHWLVSNGYEGLSNIQLIAHSAGAAVINEAAHVLVDEGTRSHTPTIQTTFLDPYSNFGGKDQYGSYSTWSDDYYSQDWTGPSTEANLTHAFNVNVTNLDPSVISGGQTSHSWPITFYQNTIDAASGAGFPISLMGGHWNPAAFAEGNSPALVLGASPPPFVSPTYSYTTAPTINIATLQAEAGKIAVSPSGTVLIDASELKLSALPADPTPQNGAKSISPPPGLSGPAWMAALIPVATTTNSVSFNADFTSDSGATGLLSVYWDGNLVATIDERYTLNGIQEYSYGLPASYDFGSYTLAFRLDDFSGIASSVSITDIAPGYANLSVPEPSPIAAFFWVGALSLWSRRRRVRAAQVV